MSKINRRDYLKQMAAASAIVGVSKLLSPSSSLAEVRHRQPPVPQNTEKARFLFTPTTDTFPSTANLTVLFGGLMGISNTKNGAAQVGFQKGKGKHKLEMSLYVITSGKCHKLHSIPAGDLADAERIELGVQDPTANVNFFHKDNFHRDLTTDDAKDFGWMLDFEDSPLYSDGVEIIKKFSPVLTLRHGTFYTHQLTNSKFDLVDVKSNNTVLQPLNQLPLLMGAAIDIPVEKDAVLKVDENIVAELPYIANVRYEIQFMNHCFDGGSHCKWEKPQDPSEKVRNDFYMHYFMFKPTKPSPKKYGVMPPDLKGGKTPLKMCPQLMKEATDEAPCMATGYGRKPGFD